MLLRFTIKNVFSVGHQREFNTMPNKRRGTLMHHIYNECDFEFLKMASIYGANGSGKSNIIKSLRLIQALVTNTKHPYGLLDTTFKFGNEKDQLLAIEYIEDGIPFYYAMILNEDRIAVEELYISGLGKNDDKLIYERRTDENNKTSIMFMDEFENINDNQVLKKILLQEFVKPDKPVMKLLSRRDNELLEPIKKAYKWFDETLQIITPEAQISILPHKMDVDPEFKKYVTQMMCSFNLGITDIKTDKIELDEVLGLENSNEDIEKIKKDLMREPETVISMRDKQKNEIVFVNENDKIMVKRLTVGHTGDDDKTVYFDIEEESDGTRRMLDYVPALRYIVFAPRVFVIDEIERSIHPLLIKEVVEKFSRDKNTRGQLIFTTHETNLLDQSIFRQDEIWFTEKDNNGSTDLYSLNDFKEHNSIDIQKGYLSGRYGSIPFLGNLKDLNWNKNDTCE